MGEELKGKVSADISQFQTGIAKAKAIAKDFGVSAEKNLGIGAFKGMIAGALSVGAVTNGINALLEKADGIDALAKRFDLTAEAVQSIQYAADQSGASAEAMFIGLKKVSMAQQEALGGNKDLAAAFSNLGISIDDLKTKTFEQIFFQIGKNVNGASLATVKLDDAIKVFGKSGDQVLGAMRDGFAEVAEGAKAAGVVIANETVSRLAKANDELAKLKKQAIVIAGEAAAPATSAISRMDEAMNVAATLRAQRSLFQNTIDDLSGLGTWSDIFGALSVKPSAKFFEKTKDDQGGAAPPPPTPNVPVFKGVSIPSMNLTSNQQIGAYSAQNPMLNRQLAIEQAMLDLQRKAEKSSVDTARNTAETVKQLARLSDFQ